MTSVARQRLQALSEQLAAPIGDQGNFENIPRLKKIAQDSIGPRVKGKVVIVTGQLGLTTSCDHNDKTKCSNISSQAQTLP
jgi:hypothetical protein